MAVSRARRSGLDTMRSTLPIAVVMAAALADVAGGPLPAVVVTHGGSIRAVRGLDRPDGEPVGNCALYRLPAASAASAASTPRP